MSPAAKRGPLTSGLSPLNWRFSLASHRPADEGQLWACSTSPLDGRTRYALVLCRLRRAKKGGESRVSAASSSAPRIRRRCAPGTRSTWGLTSRTGVVQPSPGPTPQETRPREPRSGPSVRQTAITSLQASRPSWSTIESRTWPPCFKHYAKKAAPCLKRQTTLSTGSSDGSWTLKATRSSSGSHRPGSECVRRAGTIRLVVRPLTFTAMDTSARHLLAWWVAMRAHASPNAYLPDCPGLRLGGLHECGF